MKITHQQGDPRTLTLLDVNARFMPYGKFQVLVERIKEDGVRQQWPFVWRDPDSGNLIVLSGNQRVKPRTVVPLSTLFGNGLTAQDAAVIARALSKMKARSEIKEPFDALAIWANTYLTEKP